MGLLRLLKLVAIALAVVLPLRAWVAEPIYVASPSMEPTLRTGTMMILDGHGNPKIAVMRKLACVAM